jgi:predicted ATPase
MAFAEIAPCNYFGGPALIADGKYAEGYEVATRGVQNWNATGGKCMDPFPNTFRALALGRLGRLDEGIALARETIAFAEQFSHRFFQPLTYRVLGELLIDAHQPGDSRLEEAEDALKEALRMSRAGGAKGFELLAATSLARVWHSQGKSEEARELLAPIYAWFTEGFDTRDLKEAKALLDNLQR